MKTLTDIVKDQMPGGPLLSFDRMDIERRLGFPSGQYTNAGPLLPPLGAIILTVTFYGILSLLPSSYWTRMFTLRGPTQYVTVFMASYSVMILIIKRLKIPVQCKALSIRLLPPEDPGFVLTPESADQVLENVYRAADDPHRFLLTNRIQTALANLRNMGRIGDVGDVLRTQSENDEAILDSGYTLLKGFIWAMPVLGFIGTVLGLSDALGSFGSVLSSAEKIDQLKEALLKVTAGLSTAFETTLVGLVATLGVHMWMITIRRREEQFLDECKAYCQRYIVNRLRLTEAQEEKSL